ncbi:hypothetical protein JZX86_05690 [Agrobacterium rosae]|uniref:recombinase RecT n=1 Tax=Agrobacterium rosae TaxID=1972867 RepID=UPI0019D3B23C|nr:recombinase RecT [Agrobacterium rosae]MBN7804855.1 hypothetical protein [Agrobacterium rosae]
MNQIAERTERQTAAVRERIEVIDAVPLLDTSRFEHMQRVATVMARSTLMPESLYMEGKKDNKTPLPYEQILSNCFLVVNQAVRWGLDPFAVAQCVSVVHGKLCYEGKLVAAVLQAKLGMNLHHHIIGSGEETRVYMSDRPFNEEVTIGDKTGQLVTFLKPGIRVPGFRLFDGSVAEWKTNGANSPWSPKNFPRMLIYRGTRDWCRIYEPATMLGVYTDDEMVDMEDTTRSRAARDITPKPSLADRLAISREATESAEEEQEGFTATPTADEPHDALTGEILDNTDTDDSAPASSVDAGTQPAEGEVETPPATSPSELFPADRADLIECLRKMMFIPVDPLLTTPQERRNTLIAAKDMWKSQLPAELHDHIKGFVESVDAQIKADPKVMPALREKAFAHFAEVLDCQPSEIGGVNG